MKTIIRIRTASLCILLLYGVCASKAHGIEACVEEATTVEADTTLSIITCVIGGGGSDCKGKPAYPTSCSNLVLETGGSKNCGFTPNQLEPPNWNGVPSAEAARACKERLCNEAKASMRSCTNPYRKCSKCNKSSKKWETKNCGLNSVDTTCSETDWRYHYTGLLRIDGKAQDLNGDGKIDGEDSRVWYTLSYRLKRTCGYGCDYSGAPTEKDTNLLKDQSLSTDVAARASATAEAEY